MSVTSKEQQQLVVLLWLFPQITVSGILAQGPSNLTLSESLTLGSNIQNQPDPLVIGVAWDSQLPCVCVHVRMLVGAPAPPQKVSSPNSALHSRYSRPELVRHL